MALLRSLLERAAFSQPRVGAIYQEVQYPTQSLASISSQIWNLRAQFWARKILYYHPHVTDAAQVEAKQFLAWAKTPHKWTNADVMKGLGATIQVFGCFCIGEVYGRKQLFGYPVTQWAEDDRYWGWASEMRLRKAYRPKYRMNPVLEPADTPAAEIPSPPAQSA